MEIVEPKKYFLEFEWYFFVVLSCFKSQTCQLIVVIWSLEIQVGMSITNKTKHSCTIMRRMKELAERNYYTRTLQKRRLRPRPARGCPWRRTGCPPWRGAAGWCCGGAGVRGAAAGRWGDRRWTPRRAQDGWRTWWRRVVAAWRAASVPPCPRPCDRAARPPVRYWRTAGEGAGRRAPDPAPPSRPRGWSTT